MSLYYSVERSPEYLEHHGILGMKWGIRRYQNKDGSLTPEGRARYGDILTKKQMKGYIRDYNLRTGEDRKITKKTVFRTPNGMYDHKGRKMNTDTEVRAPQEDREKKTDTSDINKPKKLADMSDEELRAINNRMQMEINYRNNLATLNPKKVSAGRQMVDNFKKNMISSIPQAASNVVRNYIEESLRSDKNNTDNKSNTNIDWRTAGDKELQAAINRKRQENTYQELMNKDVSSAKNDEYLSKYGEALAKDIIQNSSWDDMTDYNGKRYKWK